MTERGTEPKVVCSTLDRIAPDAGWLEEMADWRVLPEHSRSVVARAGKVLADGGPPDKWANAVDVISNWRAAHGVPLNTIQNDLRNAARRIDPKCDTVQRLKRLASIQAKLERSNLRITSMQDIGGCRAVLENVGLARKLYNRYLGSNRLAHELWGRDDYIECPAESGYRGYHLKLKYISAIDPESPYNGMRIEVQIRSHYQHVWATAVEIVGEMRGENLKGGQGSAKWLRFFALVGSMIAIVEHCPIVPGTPSNVSEMLGELSDLEKELDARNYLLGCTAGMQMTTDIPRHIKDGKHYYIMELDVEKRTTSIFVFTLNQIRKAVEKLKQREFELSEDTSSHKRNVVLVAADSISSLHTAYPNYYMDTELFLGLLEGFLEHA